MDQVEVVIVTGMSGAGKTSAMACFENLAFRCIDNYPVPLLTEFAELVQDNSQYQRVAMAVSLEDALKAIRLLNNLDWINLTVVFLDCDDETLVKRYKQTRRSHPLLISNKASSLLEAIEFERRLAEPISRLANIYIDTTKLKGARFQDLLEDYFNKGKLDPFRITFVSFGYKHGVPKDADLLLDVRFLPNPFYIEELRQLTGNDQAVYDYVMEKEETKIFVEKTTEFLDYLLKEYEKEGKMHLVIGISNNQTNTDWGHQTDASLDGRKKGVYMNPANNPQGGAVKNGPTACLNSLAKFNAKYHGGSVQNMKFTPRMMHEDKEKVKILFDTYFKKGGCQLMVTCVDHGVLEDAQKHPENYPDLIVREAGYSAVFVNLTPDIQAELLSRTLYD